MIREVCDVAGRKSRNDEEDEGEEGWQEEAWDDVKGVVLPSELVKAARKEEIGYMQNKPPNGMWTI